MLLAAEIVTLLEGPGCRAPGNAGGSLTSERHLKLHLVSRNTPVVL